LLDVQQTNWVTEFQTLCIDISGLVGLDEHVNTLRYSKQRTL